MFGRRLYGRIGLKRNVALTLLMERITKRGERSSTIWNRRVA